MRKILFLLVVALAVSAWGQAPPKPQTTQKALQEWRDARFGMFIHWGLYAIPAGEWKGQEVPGIGEWIMSHARIPVAEYERLAPQFNPTHFNAEEWVRVAKEAGVKYIVITTKHHDGFSMYASKASPYNVVDATPFRHDPLKDLAAACQKAGIKLGFYYSQTQDWHEPDGYGNDWDFPESTTEKFAKENFPRYIEAKVKPQLRELLTNYGPISLIWFDTYKIMTKEQSQDLADFVHKLQPNCLVSGRIGNDVGDYDSTGDNQISVGKTRKPWEAPVTLNDTWGFKKNDQNWKTVPVLIQQLAQTVSQDGNYLLNVGPDADGVIPVPSVERLEEMGRWMRVNGASIYGTAPSPYPYPQEWGAITSKPGRLYLHVFQWPEKELVLTGLRNKVTGAYLLANNSKLRVVRDSDQVLRIQLPATAPDIDDSVIVLNIAGAPQVEQNPVQQPNGKVTLPAYLGEIKRSGAAPGLRLDSRGVVEKWLTPNESISWNFNLHRPGEYDVVVMTSEQKYGKGWEGGHQVAIDVAGQQLKNKIARDKVVEVPTSPYWKHVASSMGRVKIDKAGKYSLSLKPEAIESAQKFGLTLVSVELVPVAGQ